MPRKNLWIAAGCILVLTCLLPVFSSGASPASKEKVLYSFTDGADGGLPTSDLSIDSAGNLYGTTSEGGIGCNGSGCGTVFELKRSQDSWKEDVLYSFTGGSDGDGPQAGVIFDKVGNLYGTTSTGGSNGGGTVFKLSPNSRGGWTETVIYDAFDCFSGSAGCLPRSDLVFDAKGNLYGTAQVGSSGPCAGGCGTVFELTQSGGTWTGTTIHVFEGPPGDGAIPAEGVVLDSAGNLYGATSFGGSGSCLSGYPIIGLISGCGMVYKLTPADGTWNETALYDILPGSGFGTRAAGEPFFHNPNHLLGVTQTGGNGLGTVFELVDTQTKSWRHPREAHIFYGNPDGKKPVGRLIGTVNGDLFGVTSIGGASQTQSGVVFGLSLSKSGGVERILYSFTGPPDGANPSAGLVSDSKGHLYGTTQYGGTGCNGGGCGTVYEVTP
jgi:uncharacterized repeat protein (TIGR03803 family)